MAKDNRISLRVSIDLLLDPRPAFDVFVEEMTAALRRWLSCIGGHTEALLCHPAGIIYPTQFSSEEQYTEDLHEGFPTLIQSSILSIVRFALHTLYLAIRRSYLCHRAHYRLRQSGPAENTPVVTG